SPRPTASPRWRSPTPTTCSVRSNSRTRWQRRGSSRSSGVGLPAVFPVKMPPPPREAPPTPTAPGSVSRPRAEAANRAPLSPNSPALRGPAPSEPPHLGLAWLEGEADGLIALTGGPGGPLDAAMVAGQGHLADLRCEALARLFGDRLYIELQRHGSGAERSAEP